MSVTRICYAGLDRCFGPDLIVKYRLTLTMISSRLYEKSPSTFGRNELSRKKLLNVMTLDVEEACEGEKMAEIATDVPTS